jgi:hypothetical protein
VKSFRCTHGADLIAAYSPKTRTVVLANRPTIVQLSPLSVELFIDWLVSAYAATGGADFDFDQDFDVEISASKNHAVETSMALH